MSTTRSQRDPRTDTDFAWEVAVNPSAYQKSTLNKLLRRGAAHYSGGPSKEDENPDSRPLLEDDVQAFLLRALKDKPEEKEIVSNPDIAPDEPGRLVLLAAFSEMMVKHHPVVISDARDSKMPDFLRDYYRHHIFAASIKYTNSNVIKKALGASVFGRDKEDDRGPPIGEPIEDIVSHNGKEYFKIPIAQASTKCLVENDEGVVSHIQGPYVYIPIQFVAEEYNLYLYNERYDSVIGEFSQIITDRNDRQRIQEFIEYMDEFNDYLDQLETSNYISHLFYEREFPKELEVILRAVKGTNPEVARLGVELRAGDIHKAIEQLAHETEYTWIENVCDGLSTPTIIGKTLSKLGETHSDYIEIRDGPSYQLYVLQYRRGNYMMIDVNEIADIEEFPCFNNLHETLHTRKPVRWYLYTLIRYIESLEKDFSKEDIVEYFSQFPWYDEEITSYEVEYELDHTNDEVALPISCSNDNKNFHQICIGRQNCDYDLYKSVDFNREVKDKLSWENFNMTSSSS